MGSASNLFKQKKESMNSKTGHLKLLSQKSKKKNESRKMKKAQDT